MGVNFMTMRLLEFYRKELGAWSLYKKVNNFCIKFIFGINLLCIALFLFFLLTKKTELSLVFLLLFFTFYIIFLFVLRNEIKNFCTKEGKENLYEYKKDMVKNFLINDRKFNKKEQLELLKNKMKKLSEGFKSYHILDKGIFVLLTIPLINEYVSVVFKGVDNLGIATLLFSIGMLIILLISFLYKNTIDFLSDVFMRKVETAKILEEIIDELIIEGWDPSTKILIK